MTTTTTMSDTRSKVSTKKNGQIKVVTTTVDLYDPCPLIYSHTQFICGNPGCRTS